MFCKHCGAEISDKAAICVKCGVATAPSGALDSGEKSDKTRIAYILLGLFLGGLGIHNFYVGRTTQGVIQLLMCLVTGWLVFPLIAVWIWVLIEVCTVDKDAKGKKLA